MSIEEDINKSLLEGRIIKLTGDITEESVDKVIDKLLLLDHKSNDEISLYVNSYGGNIPDSLGIYDVIQNIKSPVSTIGVTKCMSAGCFILAAGTPGKRYALPNCTIMIHPAHQRFNYAPTEELLIQMKEHERVVNNYFSIFAKNIKKSEDYVKDLARCTNYMNVDKALELGIIDSILTPESKVNKIGLTLAKGTTNDFVINKGQV